MDFSKLKDTVTKEAKEFGEKIKEGVKREHLSDTGGTQDSGSVRDATQTGAGISGDRGSTDRVEKDTSNFTSSSDMESDEE